MKPGIYYRQIDGVSISFKRPMIIAIVGESGSGKTSLSLYLQRYKRINAITSYTTRPMREGETNGIDHWFVDASKKPSSDRMLAYTEFGGYEYWADTEDIDNSVNTYVIDEKGLKELMIKWKNTFHIVPVYIVRPNNPTDKDRKDRDKERITLGCNIYRGNIINDYVFLSDFLVSASNTIINLIAKEANGSTY